jgi:pimeloyl-ACP methyl ester carboxylesterase
MTAVQSQFVQVGERRVLVRHAGRGPALVLLHQSPQSSAALQPLIERWSDRFAVFAPDTPGFGHSDPLPLAQPTIPDLAAALGALLQALGLARVLLYGVHTGASIAARLAQDEPARVAGLVCDGLALFTAEERAPLLDGYLPPFEPVWDGTHLLWLWARLREQTLFFPWHHGTAAARMMYPLASTAKLHADTLDLLAAGDGYRAGYRAPLLYEHSAEGAARLAVPARLLYRDSDVLRPHLARLGALPDGVIASAVADAQALAAQAEAMFDEAAASASHVDARAQVAAVTSPRHVRVPDARGALAFLRAGGDIAGSVTALSLGDIGQPACLPVRRDAAVAALALELPGHGASDGRREEDLAPAVLAGSVLAALDALGVQAVTLQAEGGSAALAAALAARLGPRCRGLTLHDPLPLAPHEAAWLIGSLPTLTPQASGAHLIEAWNHARLARLFSPWRAPTAESALPCAAPPPRQVHAEVVEMVRAGPAWAALWRRALAVDLAAALRPLACPLRIQVRRGDAERLRLAAGLATALALPAVPPGPDAGAAWAPAVTA